MAFQPAVNQELKIGSSVYRVAEHPAAPGAPYGQEGRAGTVWQLMVDGAGKRQEEQFLDRVALKVFIPRFRTPSLVALADRLAGLADLPGLQVCQRTVLVPQRHGGLLRAYPDLTYAVVMPWMEGPTWTQIMLEQQALSQEHCLALARSLASTLARLEQRGIAHCDLSAPNLILTTPKRIKAAIPASEVALVDVEQLFGPGLDRPEFVPSGSRGYAHCTAAQGLWSAVADRFAGAILMSEMLAWCDPRIRTAADGETYFPPDQLQQPHENCRLITEVLTERYGAAPAELFERAWASETLADCPTFGEWLIALPELDGGSDDGHLAAVITSWPCANKYCAMENPAGTKFCLRCRTPLVQPCPECGLDASLLATGLCTACGIAYKVAADRAELRQQMQAAETERARLQRELVAARKQSAHSRLLLVMLVLMGLLDLIFLTQTLLLITIAILVLYVMVFAVRANARRRKITPLNEALAQQESQLRALQQRHDDLR